MTIRIGVKNKRYSPQKPHRRKHADSVKRIMYSMKNHPPAAKIILGIFWAIIVMLNE